MNRDFTKWLNTFRNSICNYEYYVNFDKVYSNIDNIKVELNIMNSLIGSDNIEHDFMQLMEKYPEILKCIPILLAVRSYEIYAIDADGEYLFDFSSPNYSISDYVMFMKKTGLFDLIANHLINNLVDYVLGVEVGLDSNGRKNRGGHLMEDFIESQLQDVGLIKNKTYFKEMKLSTIENTWGIDLSRISNQGKAEKRFDFVVRKGNTIYALETNFYTGGGSKLNETARSYKTIAMEASGIDNFIFVWFTDGCGWRSARHNLEETFDAMEHIYNISDIENGIIRNLFVE